MFYTLKGVVLLALSIQFSFSTNINDWLRKEQDRSFDYLMDNISRADTPKGFVVASPSKFDPNYYYHWVRDAALVMSAIDFHLDDYGSGWDYKLELFDDYIQLLKNHQTVQKITDQGEPKFNADGSSYSGPWGRPQNDGPALRALTLTRLALYLIERGEEDYVREHMYGGEIPAQGVIKVDLEYVSHHWQNPDFDLWEEVMGTHFYTRMAQRSALLLGSELAEKLGDQGAADWYLEQAVKINNQLDDHWDSNSGYILTTLNRVGGLDYKYSNLDTSVILAVNHSWQEGLSFGPSDQRVWKTFLALEKKFKEIYPINNKFEGTAIGRYPEDTYFGGNPWFLLTNAMAEYLFTIGENERAEGYLKRVKAHMGKDGRMDEQFDKHSGYMLGAHDLTWSYASFLTIK